ncbi:MAG TPA: ABC transporter substrate-binding protein [Desulfomonilaceae bacterium]|nr:ABC transporter substrate-binding protein [Desulfomonilaceae bacterium]
MTGRKLLAGIVFVFACMVPYQAHSAESANTITIGAVMPITGVFGYAGVVGNAAAEDAIAMANEEGGINGKKIRYVYEDGQYNVGIATEAFKKIISLENPLSMVGESTAMGKALGPDIKSQYKLLYGSTSFSSELADTAMNPYMFVAGPTYGDMFGILLKYIAKEKPGAKVAFFYSDTEFGNDPIKFARLLMARLRLNLVAEEVVPLGTKDLTPQIADLKSKDPDFVIFQGFLVDPVPQVIKACRDLGMKCTFMGTFWGATKVILDKLGPLAENYMAVNPYMYWWNDDVPMIKKVREYTAKHRPEVQFRDNVYMQGLMNVLVITECMKRADRAGELTREGVAKALQSLKDFETGGLSAPFTVKNNKFPVARVWKANVQKGIYEPETDWIKLDKY